MNVKVKVKRAGRKRRAAGWMLLALGLLVAGVWVWSGWYVGETGGTGWRLVASGGRLEVVVDRERNESRGTWIYKSPDGPDIKWLVAPGEFYPFRGRRTWNGEIVLWERANPLQGVAMFSGQMVLWPLPLMLSTTGGLALWSGRRARRRAFEGHCPTCGYNLAGLNRDAGVCPECGRKEAATA